MIRGLQPCCRDNPALTAVCVLVDREIRTVGRSRQGPLGGAGGGLSGGRLGVGPQQLNPAERLASIESATVTTLAKSSLALRVKFRGGVADV